MLKQLSLILGILLIIGSGFAFLLGGTEAAKAPFSTGIVLIFASTLKD